MDNIEKSPGMQAIATMNEINKEIVFRKPVGVPKRRKNQNVLDEDTYVEELGKIIQRDFFPDLEKLRAQNEYLEAMEKNDLIKLRELYAKYSGPRRPTHRIPSPATFETPANIHNSQMPPPTTASTEDKLEDASQNKAEPRLSLDQFLNANTSQDNLSFEELMVESEAKHRQKYSYLYNEEEKSEREVQEMLALPSIEKQAALPEKKFVVDTWSYKNRNYIMYVPDGVDLTREEELELHKKRKEIVYGNTRLTQNPFNENQSKETICELAKSQAKVLDGKIGVDGKELIQSDTPKINGFSFVRTPSPNPGVAESPLMTWGEIEGTPFRLDGGDTPLPRSQGPSFKMAEPPRREQIALALAEKVGVRHRDEKKKAMDAARRHFASPSPRPSSSTIDRLATMSPAARKLATTKLRMSYSPSNLASRSVYSPSPVPRSKTPSTPRSAITPKLNLGIRKSADNLTDDLLKINLPKRQKASDFF
ncbi:es-2 protein - related [Holotrichia oblita]|uniref:Es-2 protein - related n=1 Tax=Holotrichia oblita TaxID=644536 RepID=A0ACB9SKS1_HOLOL|nr:es-2 protein - related [Holotrichia oblita]